MEWDEVTIGGLPLRITAGADGIQSIGFHLANTASGNRNRDNALVRETVLQLQAYFTGRLRRFHLPLDYHGTDFQKRVWGQLQTIPWGATRSYAQVAEALGAPKAVRAVGAANGANPIAIVVPCHRVIGSSGRLVGYGGGLPLKQRLLELEGAASMQLGLTP